SPSCGARVRSRAYSGGTQSDRTGFPPPGADLGTLHCVLGTVPVLTSVLRTVYFGLSTRYSHRTNDPPGGGPKPAGVTLGITDGGGPSGSGGAGGIGLTPGPGRGVGGGSGVGPGVTGGWSTLGGGELGEGSAQPRWRRLSAALIRSSVRSGGAGVISK